MKVIYFNYLYDTQNLSVGSSVHVNEFVKEFQKFHDIKVFNQNRFNYNGSTQEPGFYSRIKIALKRKLSRWLNQIMALLKNAKYVVSESKIINKERPDVILTRYDLMNFSSILLAKLKGIPIILEVNSPHAYESKKFYKQYFQLPIIPGLIEKLNLKFSDAVVVVSNDLKDYFVGLGIPQGKIHVVSNGVDVSKFTANDRKNNIKKNPDFADKIVIGYVGSFHYWHGLDKIQTVIQELLNFHQDVHFLLVGDGVLRHDLLEFVKVEKIESRVRLPGYIPHQDIPNYLSTMDIMMAPYPNFELFYYSPLKLFEYMASGKAIVASRIGQIKEILTEKDNGLMFEAGNYNELIEQLKLLVSNPDLRERIGK